MCEVSGRLLVMVKPRLSYHVVFVLWRRWKYLNCISLMKRRGGELNSACILADALIFCAGRGRFGEIQRMNHLEELASGSLSSADSQMKAGHRRELAWKYVVKTLEMILWPLNTTSGSKVCLICVEVNYESYRCFCLTTTRNTEVEVNMEIKTYLT